MTTEPNGLIQIVPNLSPVIDGIGDYALQLAKQLRRHCGIESSFVVCNPTWPRRDWHGTFQAVGLREQSPSTLLDAVHLLSQQYGQIKAPILLHFSPYGYEKRGCPFWLIDGLESLNKTSSERINIGFHELEVSKGKPWSSSFWIPGLQRDLIRRLLKLGGFTYTNTALHGSKLEAWGGQSVTLIPNFSNVGELEEPPAARRRSSEIVIFGRADQRRWTYEKGGKALALLCGHLGTECIIDIGYALPKHVIPQIDGVLIDQRGVLPPDEIARVMQSALASFMYYPIPLLTKSGVHALACASGTVSFVATDSTVGAACPGLQPGVDYIRVGDGLLPTRACLQELAPAIYGSYAKRTSQMAAVTIANQLRLSAKRKADRLSWTHKASSTKYSSRFQEKPVSARTLTADGEVSQ